MPGDGPADDVSPLSWPQERLRNICILAHVDHSTTCADNLISSNGIISKHSTGKVRYLDSRVDEQERQITMKSSAIALRYASPAGDAYLVNLIDSPGHVDFGSEVSMAARLADGAIVVVDVVEGVEAQTRAVLRQAWRDRVKTCLFLNKVDRLIVELEMTPLDAYEHLLKIVEQVNAVNQQLLSEEVYAHPGGDEQHAAASADSAADGVDLSAAWVEVDRAEQALCYSPERGNVAFGSASHCWAFRLDTFASMIAGKMGAKTESLKRVLWGEWAFNKKTRRAQRRQAGDTKTKPMFVEFVLQQIWTIYNAAFRTIDTEVLKKVQASIPAWKDIGIDGLSPGSAAIRELFSAWLPFERSVLSMITQHLPNPLEAAADRLPVICPKWFAAGSKGALAQSPIAAGLRASDPGATAVVYLAKFLGADLERLVLTGDTLRGDEDVHFVGICRVFAGTLRAGSDVFVMREDAGEGAGATPRSLRVVRLFSLMGRYMREQPEAQSGSIVAVQVEGQSGGADLGVERCLTLCGAAEGPCLETPYSSQAFAIVRVSLEPQHVADLNALARGLRLLHKADPSVSVEAMVTGENVLGCCGDEHLKRCISDLQKLYAKDIPLHISTPLVAIRESFVDAVPAERVDPKAHPLFLPSWASHLLDASTEAGSVVSAPASEPEAAPSDQGAAPVQERLSMSPSGVMSVWTANRKACVRIAAVALPAEVLEWMDQCAEELETVIHRQRPSVALTNGREATLGECLAEVERLFAERLASAGAGGCAGVLCGMSVAKGGRAVLLDATGSGWSLAGGGKAPGAGADADAAAQQVPAWARPSVLSGFCLAANAGPLCEEPMRGVALVLHGFRQAAGPEDAGAAAEGAPPAAALAPPDTYGPMSGQVMVATKEACRYSLFRRGFARVSEVMLAVDVQCEQEMLGKVYGVLGKRRAKVLDEGLRDGTSLFYIRSHLPLADSFGLAQDLRQAASGNVSLHCAFSHWEQSEDDPFQEASLTAEELEDLGEGPLPPNNARKLVDAIRKRKGLPTDEKVVSCATNQRTLARPPAEPPRLVLGGLGRQRPAPCLPCGLPRIPRASEPPRPGPAGADSAGSQPPARLCDSMPSGPLRGCSGLLHLSSARHQRAGPAPRAWPGREDAVASRLLVALDGEVADAPSSAAPVAASVAPPGARRVPLAPGAPSGLIIPAALHARPAALGMALVTVVLGLVVPWDRGLALPGCAVASSQSSGRSLALPRQAPVLPMAGPPQEAQVPRRDAPQLFEDEAARLGIPLRDLQSFAARAPPAPPRVQAWTSTPASALVAAWGAPRPAGLSVKPSPLAPVLLSAVGPSSAAEERKQRFKRPCDAYEGSRAAPGVQSSGGGGAAAQALARAEDLGKGAHKGKTTPGHSFLLSALDAAVSERALAARAERAALRSALHGASDAPAGRSAAPGPSSLARARSVAPADAELAEVAEAVRPELQSLRDARAGFAARLLATLSECEGQFCTARRWRIPLVWRVGLMWLGGALPLRQRGVRSQSWRQSARWGLRLCLAAADHIESGAPCVPSEVETIAMGMIDATDNSFAEGHADFAFSSGVDERRLPPFLASRERRVALDGARDPVGQQRMPCMASMRSLREAGKVLGLEGTALSEDVRTGLVVRGDGDNMERPRSRKQLEQLKIAQSEVLRHEAKKPTAHSELVEQFEQPDLVEKRLDALETSVAYTLRENSLKQKPEQLEVRSDLNLGLQKCLGAGSFGGSWRHRVQAGWRVLLIVGFQCGVRAGRHRRPCAASTGPLPGPGAGNDRFVHRRQRRRSTGRLRLGTGLAAPLVLAWLFPRRSSCSAAEYVLGGEVEKLVESWRASKEVEEKRLLWRTEGIKKTEKGEGAPPWVDFDPKKCRVQSKKELDDERTEWRRSVNFSGTTVGPTSKEDSQARFEMTSEAKDGRVQSQVSSSAFARDPNAPRPKGDKGAKGAEKGSKGGKGKRRERDGDYEEEKRAPERDRTPLHAEPLQPNGGLRGPGGAANSLAAFIKPAKGMDPDAVAALLAPDTKAPK
ncbi:unnamed protein product, partial [Prorocentrum cordatum]